MLAVTKSSGWPAPVRRAAEAVNQGVVPETEKVLPGVKEPSGWPVGVTSGVAVAKVLLLALSSDVGEDAGDREREQRKRRHRVLGPIGERHSPSGCSSPG